jgi:hypothetical protein
MTVELLQITSQITNLKIMVILTVDLVDTAMEILLILEDPSLTKVKFKKLKKIKET